MERIIVWQRWAQRAEPSREAVATAVLWRSAARERFLSVGAETLIEIGATIAFSLAPSQLARVIELCTIGVREAERDGSGHGGLTYGLALGSIELDLEHGSYVGDVIDRAQALANAGEPHEVVLDANAERASGGAFLFARELTCGFGMSAVVLDRAFPKRSDCQRALVQLERPALPAHGLVQFEALRKLAKTSGRHRVLLVGQHGLGLSQWIEHIANELAPPLWLELGALGTSLAPLGSLMAALRHVPDDAAPERLLARDEEPDRHALTTLQAIRAGAAVTRRDAVLALRQYVGRASERGPRALISVDPTPLIDPSSVGVIAEATRDGGPDMLVMMRLLPDSKPPEAFARSAGLSELRVRGLSQQEARALAAALLHSEVPDDIARRAAAMGGANPLAVTEAVRVLVASGDVVCAAGAFRWRRGPAGRLDTMSFEAMFEERVDALAAPLRRALEVVANLPDPNDHELAREVAAIDGFVPETWTRALEELAAFGFLHVGERGIVLSSALRLVVQASMAPARALELNGSIARVLTHQLSSEATFARAGLAHYLARAGSVEEAARVFIEVADLAAQHGFVRSGVRLAAAAVECDPSDATRARTAQLVERINERQPGKPPPPPLAREALERATPARVVTHGVANNAQRRAVDAILARDFEEVERALELLVASGRSGASIDRLRTIALLAKGDCEGASSLLERLSAREQRGRVTPRLALTRALVALTTGEFDEAVRAALGALASTRKARDPVGERAALGVLAMCYRQLGRDADAARLTSAALEAQALA